MVSRRTEIDGRSDSGSTSVIQLGFWLHMAVFTAINVLLFVVNMLVDRSNPWFLYCLWGWGMLLAFQAGCTFRWRGLLGAHAALTAVLLAGLSGINMVFGGGPWVIWILVSLGIPLFAHALYALDKVTLINAHAIASALWLVEILITQVMFFKHWWEFAIAMLSSAVGLALLLIVHARFRKDLPERFRGVR